MICYITILRAFHRKTSLKVKRQPTEWRIFVIHRSNEGLIHNIQMITSQKRSPEKVGDWQFLTVLK